jgi:cell division protein FtsB
MSAAKSKKSKMSSPIKRWLKSKYGVVTVLFLVWMVFLDDHNIMTRYKLDLTVRQLEQEVVDNYDRLEQAKIDKVEMEQNIEKYAREKYYMHKPNEDVLIIDIQSENE